MSGVILSVCNVAVARRLGLHPEEDGEQQHYEKEEDGATHSQGHDHLWAQRRGKKGMSASIQPILECLPIFECQVLFLQWGCPQLVTNAIKQSKIRGKGWRGRTRKA